MIFGNRQGASDAPGSITDLRNMGYITREEIAQNMGAGRNMHLLPRRQAQCRVRARVRKTEIVLFGCPAALRAKRRPKLNPPCLS